MSDEIIRIKNGKLMLNGKSIERKRKQLVFLLIDVSGSMEEFVGESAKLLTNSANFIMPMGNNIGMLIPIK